MLPGEDCITWGSLLPADASFCFGKKSLLEKGALLREDCVSIAFCAACVRCKSV